MWCCRLFAVDPFVILSWVFFISAEQVMDDVGNQTSCRLAGLRPGTVYFVQVCVCARVPKSTFVFLSWCFGAHHFCSSSRSAVTLWASTALGKLESGASGVIPPLRPRPTAVSTHTHRKTFLRGNIFHEISFISRRIINWQPQRKRSCGFHVLRQFGCLFYTVLAVLWPACLSNKTQRHRQKNSQKKPEIKAKSNSKSTARRIRKSQPNK